MLCTENSHPYLRLWIKSNINRNPNPNLNRNPNPNGNHNLNPNPNPSPNLSRKFRSSLATQIASTALALKRTSARAWTDGAVLLATNVSIESYMFIEYSVFCLAWDNFTAKYARNGLHFNSSRLACLYKTNATRQNKTFLVDCYKF